MNKEHNLQRIQFELYQTCKHLGLDYSKASYEQILDAVCRKADMDRLKNILQHSEQQLGSDSTHTQIVKRVLIERETKQNNRLSLAQRTMFDDVKCDFWQNEQGDIFMTITQLATALEYASKSAIENMLSRNKYLKETQFSSTHKTWVGNTKQHTRIFTEDGIYEVTMLSRQPKAKEFRAWVRQVIKTLRQGEVVVWEKSVPKEQSLEMMKIKTQQAQLLYDIALEFKEILPVGQIEGLVKQVREILY